MNEYYYCLASKMIALIGVCFILYFDKINNWFVILPMLFMAIMDGTADDKGKKNEKINS